MALHLGHRVARAPVDLLGAPKDAVQLDEELVVVRFESGEPSAAVSWARQRSIFSGVMSSTRSAPDAGNRCAEMIER
jgi:hypothetical protein